MSEQSYFYNKPINFNKCYQSQRKEINNPKLKVESHHKVRSESLSKNENVKKHKSEKIKKHIVDEIINKIVDSYLYIAISAVIGDKTYQARRDAKDILNKALYMIDNCDSKNILNDCFIEDLIKLSDKMRKLEFDVCEDPWR